MEIKTRFFGMPEGIDEEDYEISVYRDEDCERKLKSIDFGPIKPGEEKSEWVWIKNTGRASMAEVCVGMGIIGERGWETKTENYIQGSLEVGEKNRVPFNLKVEPDASPGEYSGEIPITVYGSENLPLNY